MLKQLKFMQKKILLLIPTLNEYNNIFKLYYKIRLYHKSIHMLFVDDGSSDGTYQFIKKIVKKNNSKNFCLRRSKRLGIGRAHKDGYNWAFKHKYDYLITMDSDFSHNPKYISKIIFNIKDNDLIVGSRHLKKNSTPNWPLFRKILTYGSKLFSKMLFGHTIDSTNSFRCYNLKTINKNFLNYCHSDHYDFFFTSLNILVKNNYKIKEISQIIYSRVEGNSKYYFKYIVKSIFNFFWLYFKLNSFKLR